MLEKSVGEESCEVLEKNVVERSVVKKCWRREL